MTGPKPIGILFSGCSPGDYWIISSVFKGIAVYFTGSILSNKVDFSDIFDIGVDDNPLFARKFESYDEAVIISKKLPSFKYYTWQVVKLTVFKTDEKI